MKKSISLLFTAIVFIFSCCFVYAQDIAGTWQGTLTVAPGNELVVQFIIEEDSGGSYSATLNSPDSGAIKNIAATKASFADNKLIIDVADLSGKFEGDFADGTIVGDWTQPGQTIPLTLTPFVDGPLDESILQAYVGRWEGSLALPGQSLTIVINFEKTANGKLSGTMESPDQGAQKFPVENIQASTSDLKIEVNAIRGIYTAKLSSEGLQGDWSQGRSFPLNMKRKTLDPLEFALDLSADEKQLFMGTWHGEMTTPVGPVAAVFRIEEVEEGSILGFFDSPDRGAKNIALKTVSREGDDVSFIARSGSTFKGKIVDGKLVGDYSQQGQKFPVTLEQGDLPPLVVAAPTSLLGNWQGKITTPRGEFTVVFRFEETSAGVVVFLDSPDQGMAGARIRIASLTDNTVKIASPLIGISYEGTLSDNKIEGKATQGGQTFDLNLER
ncbi:hypothetical protein [Aurantivibrio infirmus]